MSDQNDTPEDNKELDDSAAPVPEAAVVEPEGPRDEAREAILGRFVEALGEAVLDSHIVVDKDLWIRVSADAWHEAGEVARNALQARYFGFLSAIDWMPSPFGRSMDSEVDRLLEAKDEAQAPEDAAVLAGTSFEHGFAGGETRFQVFARVAHIGEQGKNWGVTLKVDVPDDSLALNTWTKVYAGADWHEREAHEMFGIDFTGHPALRNMYLPTGFEGHPLRKDFPLLARHVKPWPGIVDVEQMPTNEAEQPSTEESGPAEGADS
jgi:NADH-quinone oxidoreductase subunit C